MDETGVGDAAFDAETLADLREAFGPTRVAELLEGLRRELDERLAGPAPDREGLGRHAHVLVSVSGTLSFMALSRACAELERACMASGDVATPLARVRAAAEEAKRAIDRLAAAPA